MIDELRGEIRLIVEDQRDVVCARDVFRRDDGEFMPWNIARERDVLDTAACGRAAHGCAVQHAGKRQVVDI
jgi:hypothetical protein